MGDRAPRDLPDLSLTSDPSWDRLNSKLERKDPRLTPSLTCRLRWDLLDLAALQVRSRKTPHQVTPDNCIQVSEDPRDLKGSWDLRETPETPGLPDLLDCRASRVCPA